MNANKNLVHIRVNARFVKILSENNEAKTQSWFARRG